MIFTSVIKPVVCLFLFWVLVLSRFAFAETQVEHYPNGQVKIEKEVDVFGLPHGTIRRFDPSGFLKSEKHFVRGLLEGVSRLYYKNGRVMTEWVYENGKRQGTALGYYSDGTLKDRGAYADDKLKGPVRKYYPDGSLKSEMHFEGDRPIGTAKMFDRQGRLTDEFIYRQGVLLSRKKIDPTGKVLQEQNYTPLPGP